MKGTQTRRQDGPGTPDAQGPAAERGGGTRRGLQLLAWQGGLAAQRQAQPPAQRRQAGPEEGDTASVHRAAAEGLRGGGAALPHLGAIQRSFGRHDVSGVRAHTGERAQAATAAMGAAAYATGQDVVFGAAPDLHTAAHEAAHTVQQRAGVQLSGGVGAVGDRYERHADQVADLVVRGRSAESLLGTFASAGGGGGAVQRHALEQEHVHTSHDITAAYSADLATFQGNVRDACGTFTVFRRDDGARGMDLVQNHSNLEAVHQAIGLSAQDGQVVQLSVDAARRPHDGWIITMDFTSPAEVVPPEEEAPVPSHTVTFVTQGRSTQDLQDGAVVELMGISEAEDGSMSPLPARGSVLGGFLYPLLPHFVSLQTHPQRLRRQYLEQINQHLQQAADPAEGMAVEASVTVEVQGDMQPGRAETVWCNVQGVSLRLGLAAIGGTLRPGPDPDEVRAREGRAMAFDEMRGIFMDTVLGELSPNPFGSYVNFQRRMIEAYVEFRERPLREALIQGFFDIVAWHPETGSAPPSATFDGISQAQLDGRYGRGREIGGAEKPPMYAAFWQQLHRHLTTRGTPQQRRCAEILQRPESQESRFGLIANSIRARYPSMDDRRILFESRS